MVRQLNAEFVKKVLPVRPADAHKGTFGKLMLAVGSAYYPGAVCMATLAALRTGVGIATVAAPRTVAHGFIGKIVEPTWLPLPENANGVVLPEAAERIAEKLPGYQAVCLGCGLSNEPDAEKFVCALLSLPALANKPLLLDADGINCAARHMDLLERLPARLILTPHKMEMARLCGCSVGDVSDQIASELASRLRSTLVLKSEATQIFRTDGQIFRLENAANPGLAKGGSGDVLAGIISSLCAQGVEPDDAACAGVWLHSQAGFAALRKHGTVSMLPGDLPGLLPDVFLNLQGADA